MSQAPHSLADAEADASVATERSRRGPDAWVWVTAAAGLLLVALILVVPRALKHQAGRICDVVGPECPTVSDLHRGNPYGEALTLYDRDDSVFSSVGGRRAAFVPLERIPERVQSAWIAVEDRRFREHGGVDAHAVGRAFASNLLERRIVSGASTIPMQTVRIVWEDRVRKMGRWQRKLVELATARQLVDRLGRDRVLELYLNGVYLGEGVYGVGAAARHYFGVGLHELTDAQLALLVGITRTPGRYNPRSAPERARERRDVVLGVLHREGLLSGTALSDALASGLDVLDSAPVTYSRDYATAAVRRELRRRAPDLMGRSGLRVFTTIDVKQQRAAESAVSRHVEAIESGEFGALSDGGHDVQAAAIAIDSRSGEILAVVGGRDFDDTEFDRALQARRQIGSLVKPLIMAAYLERGGWAGRRFTPAPVRIETSDGIWTPGDHVDADVLLPSEIVSRSSNRAAIRMGQEIGVGDFTRDLERFGLHADVTPVPSMFLGAFESSLAEVTAVYAMFDNGGNRVEAHLVRRVEDASGRTLYRFDRPHAGVRVLGTATRFLVLDAMKRVTRQGTGWRAGRAASGIPVAGKTGTTNEGRDAWFVGITPGTALGVWVGRDRPRPVVEEGTGGTLAAPLWGDLAAQFGSRSTRAPWPRPNTVRHAMIDRRTGAEVPPECAPRDSTRIAHVLVRTRPPRMVAPLADDEGGRIGIRAYRRAADRGAPPALLERGCATSLDPLNRLHSAGRPGLSGISLPSVLVTPHVRDTTRVPQERLDG